MYVKNKVTRFLDLPFYCFFSNFSSEIKKRIKKINLPNSGSVNQVKTSTLFVVILLSLRIFFDLFLQSAFKNVILCLDFSFITKFAFIHYYEFFFWHTNLKNKILIRKYIKRRVGIYKFLDVSGYI